ncbi:MAG TPA: hypothetical protein VEZ51_06580 [Gemmatimonadaceae bacterium]|nr:hypothetical protein [Gemmatimonadaceae bacterium]
MEHRRTSDVAVEEAPAASEGTGGNGKPAEHHEEGAIIAGIRATDIEPYTGLRYLSKLSRFMAIILLLLLVAEIATGLYAQGAASIPTLLGEASRLIVLAGVLWGTGDLAHLLIDVGHDVRAGRVLLARQTYHIAKDHLHDRPLSVERPVSVERARNEGAPPAGGPPIP